MSGKTETRTPVTGTLNQVKESASDLANRSTEALSNLGSKAKESASTSARVLDKCCAIIHSRWVRSPWLPEQRWD